MSEDTPPAGTAPGGDRALPTTRRRRARAIRRRVAGMSVATTLAASGAVLAQLVNGHDPLLRHGRRTATASASSRSEASPSAVTTSAS